MQRNYKILRPLLYHKVQASRLSLLDAHDTITSCTEQQRKHSVLTEGHEGGKSYN